MKSKHILNGLTLSLMLSLIPTPAHAGWFSSISNYFNQPSKNALIATTAVAGISLLATFTCAWSWWKKSTQHEQAKKSLLEKEEMHKRASIALSQQTTKCMAVIAEHNATKAKAEKALSAQKQTLTGDYSNMFIAARKTSGEKLAAKQISLNEHD